MDVAEAKEKYMRMVEREKARGNQHSCLVVFAHEDEMMSKMYRSSIQQTMTGREKSTMMNYEEDTKHICTISDDKRLY